jgi:hypothetical protein
VHYAIAFASTSRAHLMALWRRVDLWYTAKLEADRVADVGEVKLIEDLYSEIRKRGGQRAQLDFDFAVDEVAASFAATVVDVRGLRARGPLVRERRVPMFRLARDRSEAAEVVDTEHVQALLWCPTRWSVAGDQTLDFEFLARELTPMSSVAAGKRVWLTKRVERRISLDALLVTADDRTPVVAEIKVGGDENAELGLVQALAAAAQLSSDSQRRRVQREFRDYFDEAGPRAFDVYVVTARAPDRGIRPLLAERAHARASALMASGALSEWVRRIAFLEMKLIDKRPTFAVLHGP